MLERIKILIAMQLRDRHRRRKVHPLVFVLLRVLAVICITAGVWVVFFFFNNIMALRVDRAFLLFLVGLILLILMIIMAIVGPMLTPYDATTNYLDNTHQPMSSEHWFCTDALGRDIWARAWVGARVSLMIGFLARVHTQDFHLSQEVDRAVWVTPEQALTMVHPGRAISRLVLEAYLQSCGEGASGQEAGGKE